MENDEKVQAALKVELHLCRGTAGQTVECWT